VHQLTSSPLNYGGMPFAFHVVFNGNAMLRMEMHADARKAEFQLAGGSCGCGWG